VGVRKGNFTTKVDIAAPAKPVAVVSGLGAGLVTSGAHLYKITFVTVSGETTGGTASDSVTTVEAYDGQVDLSAIPTGPTGTTARKIYRTEAGGADYKLLATLANNTATTYRDNIADGSLGAAIPVANTSGLSAPGAGMAANLSTLGAGLVTSGAHLYKVSFVTASGETLASVASNSVTTAEATCGKVNLSAIPTGPTGTTGRKLYRTEAAGVDYKLLATIANNTETTYLDNIADAGLGAAEPVSDTSGLADPGASTPDDDLSTLGAGNIDSGTHSYAYTFVSACGETLPSTGSLDVTSISTVNGKVSISGILAGPTGTIARKLYRTEAGAGTYKLLATIADNTTTTYDDDTADSGLGAAAPIASTAGLANPGASTPTDDLAADGAGLLSDGAYHYKVSLVNALGETVPSDASVGVTVADHTSDGKVALTDIPVGATGCTARKIYRTEVDGSVYRYLATIADNTTTTYQDNVADASLGLAAPASNTTYLADATTAPTAALRNLGAGNVNAGVHTYKVSFVSIVGETLAGAASAGVATTAGVGKVELTNIPTGGTGTTARKLYRTEAGLAVYKLLATIADNTTATYSDNIADASLGAAEPVANTTAIAVPSACTASLTLLGAGNVDAGAHDYSVSFVSATGETDDTPISSAVTTTTQVGKVELTAIPTGGTGCTARKIYRTSAGGATYKLLATIADNTTATYSDNTADSGLGADAPAADTTQLPAPGKPTAALWDAGAGLCTIGSHLVKVAYHSWTGTGTLSAASDPVVIVASAMERVDVTLVADASADVDGIVVYMTKAGGSTYYCVGIYPNTSGDVAVDVADASLVDQHAGYDSCTSAQDNTIVATSGKRWQWVEIENTDAADPIYVSWNGLDRNLGNYDCIASGADPVRVDFTGEKVRTIRVRGGGTNGTCGWRGMEV
jgi:hypothetical protein